MTRQVQSCLKTSNSKTSLHTIGVRGSTGGLDVVGEHSRVGKRPGSIVILTEGDDELTLTASDEGGSKPREEEEQLLQRKYRL